MENNELTTERQSLSLILPRGKSQLPVIDEFADFVRRNKHSGINGHGERVPYVPYAALSSYWRPDNVQKILDTIRNPGLVHILNNFEHYLRVLSTLVYISSGSSSYPYDVLDNDLVDDKLLPRHKLPKSWIDKSPRYDFKHFLQHQWQFFPAVPGLEGLHNARLSPNRIIPIHNVVSIREGDVSSVHVVDICGCHPLEASSDDGMKASRFMAPASRGALACVSPGNKFALKTYNNETYRHLYDNEIRALSVFQSNPHPNIVKYYGSYEQSNKFNVLLEFAESGTLQDFFSVKPPPVKNEEIAEFWESLFKVAFALERVHQLTMGESGALHCAHMDLKPSNILAFQEDDGGGPYDFRWKIADFGLSQIVPVQYQKATAAKACYGQRSFSAPELTPTDAPGERDYITRSVDIWSLGCVLLEALTWLKSGSEGLKEFQDHRTDNNTRLKNVTGYESPFHDGSRVSPAVRDWFDYLRYKSPLDKFTVPLVNLVEHEMLVEDAKRRIDASSLSRKLESILWSAKSGTSTNLIDRPLSRNSLPISQPMVSLSKKPPGRMPKISRLADVARTVSKTVTKSISSHGQSCRSGLCARSSPLPRPKTDWKLSMEDVMSSRNAELTKRPVPIHLRRMIDQLQVNIAEREHIFLIDDSPSLRRHTSKVIQVFQTLAYAANGLESKAATLVFASQPTVEIRTSNPAACLENSNNIPPSHAGEVWNKSFADLIDKAIIPRLPKTELGKIHGLYKQYKPTTIFVLTDGTWQDHPGGDNSAALKRLINTVSHRKLGRSAVAIQFLSFSHDARGEKRLDFLDDFGESEHRYSIPFHIVFSDTPRLTDILSTRHVVETGHISDDVYKMLVGGMSDDWDTARDGHPEPGEPPPPSQPTLEIPEYGVSRFMGQLESFDPSAEKLGTFLGSTPAEEESSSDVILRSTLETSTAATQIVLTEPRYIWTQGINTLLQSCRSEPPVPGGKVRVRWTCRCGKHLYDDYTELRPGAALERERELQRLHGSHLAQGFADWSCNAIASAGRFLKSAASPFRNNGSNQSGILPSHQARTQSTQSSLSAASTLTTSSSGPSKDLYLLASVSQPAGQPLYQEKLENISTDRELFCFLREKFSTWVNQSRFSSFALERLSFARLSIDYSSRTDVHDHENFCLTSCHCLPSRDRITSGEYTCSTAMGEGLMPPVGHEYMTHYFHHPDHLDPRQASTLSKLPRRSRNDLRGSPDESADGWGLGVRVRRERAVAAGSIVLGGVSSAAILLFIWASVKKDIQGATGLASVLLAAAALILAYIVL